MSDPKPERAILARVAFAAFFYGFIGFVLVLAFTPIWSEWFR